MLHVRFEGRSYDLDARQVKVHNRLTDQEIKARLARYFDVAPERFDFYVIDHQPSGHMVVRPEAVYG